MISPRTVWLFIFLLGIGAVASWRVRDYVIALGAGTISLGMLLNRTAVFWNGGDMPYGAAVKKAWLPWLCDIIELPTRFAFSFFQTSIAVHSSNIGGYYSIGDLMIFFGIVAIIAVFVFRFVIHCFS